MRSKKNLRNMAERRDKAWPLAEADLTNSVCVFDFAAVLFPEQIS